MPTAVAHLLTLRPCRAARSAASVLALASLAIAQRDGAYAPHVEPASTAARDAIAGFRPADGLTVELVAAEPMLANPVAFDIGDDGRIYVVETHRLRAGVVDMRDHLSWVDEDLACTSVADRVAAIRKHFAGDLPSWRKDQERIRCLIDDDRDGTIDRAVTFADGFDELEDGIAAGVFAHGADVFFTDIPNVWRLRDADRDGVAESREVLHSGYGVHFSLIGHDLHGAVVGPDRRLWFSIGDRGFRVEQGDGVLAYPHEGAVLRCELDGSKLEVVHRGLRNPQELAFDDQGDLFTCDNNSDGGDRARLVHVIDGGHSGWTIGYQWLPTRGAWNEDGLWKPRSDEQPAWIDPPIANVADGPSGLVANPGSGLPARWNGRFFLCDFRGSASGSGVMALQLERAGASHRLVGTERVIWNVLATDCDFGPDGGLYVLDWVDGWGKTGRGRVYRVSDGRTANDPLVQEVKAMLRDGMAGRAIDELARLLGHRDRRVRQAAEFELVDRGADGVAALERVAKQNDSLLARLHAIWGLGVVARKGDVELVKRIENLVLDAEDEVRAQALRVCSDSPGPTTRQTAERALRDPSPRVRYFAAQAIGRVGQFHSFGALLGLVRRENDQDVALRHAAVVALSRIGASWRIEEFARDPSPAVRRAGVLTLRRLRHESIAVFLDDTDPSVAGEAARAIHDERIAGALPALAAWTERTDLRDERVLRRAIGAHRLLGKGTNLDALMRFAQRAAAPEPMRVEALRIVAEWPRPHGQDRVLGEWRPLPERPAIGARVRSGAMLDALAVEAGTPSAVLQAAIDAVARLKAFDVAATLEMIAVDERRDGETRALALRTLAALGSTAQRVRTARTVAPDAPLPLRRAAFDVLAKDEPTATLPLLVTLAREGSIDERRAALASLATASGQVADDAIAQELARLDAGETPKELALDVLEAGLARAGGVARTAAQKRLDELTASGDPLAPWRDCGEGGDAGRGAKLFREHAAAQCTRCHSLAGSGGQVGPALDAIGKTRDRAYLLAALVTPQRDIAEGYAQNVLKLDDGSLVAGSIVSEDAAVLVLRDANDAEVRVEKPRIRDRNRGGSAMPEISALLTRREVRDLVEFLATRRGE
ncbi:MAG: HEAT repeat domain-containing protein [Planctomycetes bacterium]|nr:HEAT repeat domain-containing protein [Planctomycetota bacterium]